MLTRIIVSAALFSLGLGFSAWAGPRIQPAPPEAESPAWVQPRQKPIPPPAPPRGQLLYENHCMACHESVVHVRSRQLARSRPELRSRVRHWAAYLNLRWGKEEIEDVVGYLDSRYYRFKSR